MPTDLGPAWVAFAGGAFGATAGALATRWTLRSAGAIAVEQRKHETDLAVIERDAQARSARDSYQVETLLELQMALHRLMRAATSVHLLDKKHHRRTGEAYGTATLDPEWNFALMEAVTTVRLLQSRVADAAVRDWSVRLINEATKVSEATTENEAEQQLADAMSTAASASGSVGDRLRDLPAPTSYRPMVTSPIWDFDRP